MHCSSTSTWEPKRSETGTDELSGFRFPERANGENQTRPNDRLLRSGTTVAYAHKLLDSGEDMARVAREAICRPMSTPWRRGRHQVRPTERPVASLGRFWCLCVARSRAPSASVASKGESWDAHGSTPGST